MDDIGSLQWKLRAREAVRAELARRYPYKLPHSIAVAVPHVVAEIETAWRCYQPRVLQDGPQGPLPLLPGAAAALFDVVRTLHEIGLALPADVVMELERLAQLALSGKGDSRGQGARPPLEVHERALRKRWRWASMHRILVLAGVRKSEEHFSREAGVDLTAYCEWPEISDAVTKAAQIAKKENGETTIQWRAYYDDFMEIEKSMAVCELWPHIYYLPSEETCEELGWDFTRKMAETWPHVERDSPLLMVA